jgi:hypothetical protein
MVGLMAQRSCFKICILPLDMQSFSLVRVIISKNDECLLLFVSFADFTSSFFSIFTVEKYLTEQGVESVGQHDKKLEEEITSKSI